MRTIAAIASASVLFLVAGAAAASGAGKAHAGPVPAGLTAPDSGTGGLDFQGSVFLGDDVASPAAVASEPVQVAPGLWLERVAPIDIDAEAVRVPPNPGSSGAVLSSPPAPATSRGDPILTCGSNTGASTQP